jgi:hypothetical protein
MKSIREQLTFPTFARYLSRQQRGYVLLLTLITAMSLFIALSGILSLSTINYSTAKRTLSDLSSQYVAEAGADKAVFEINQDNTHTGTNTVCPISGTGSNPVTFFNDAVKGKGTYETCVTNGTIPNEKIVYVTAKVYIPATAANPISVRKLKLVIEGTQQAGYAVNIGPGGLVMNNSATITTGPVYVGGYLTMNNSARIGSAGSPISVEVANARCPNGGGATYPQICASGVQPNPITLNNTARIYGNVSANGQTNTGGMSNGGLVASTGVSAPALPDYDRASHTAAVTSTLTSSAASCNGSQSKTWPANVRITGNVSLSNSCTITVNGDAWIDGNLTLSNSSILRVGAGVTTAPRIMVDGSSGISLNNTSVISTNASSIGFYFITFRSTASCSPNCTSVTGVDLYNSQQVTTININNQGLAAGSTFYARWTGLSLANGGTIGSILAQRIQLNNSGNITFGTSLAGGGTYSYDVRYYEQQ